MGLDMFLFKRHKNEDGFINEDGTIDYVRDKIGYWRKANQIHNWFIDTLTLPLDFNCEYAEVKKSTLVDLLADCEKVLNSKDKPVAKEVANSTLPTCSGFFFGDTDYDEWYYEKIENTRKMIKEIIYNTDWDNYIVEYSCWW